MGGAELCFLSATELVHRIKNRAVSARKVMEAHLEQIEQVNPKVNAIVTLVAEKALEQADEADRMLDRKDAVGVLHGLPLGVKDLVHTKGIRTTYASLIATRSRVFICDYSGLTAGQSPGVSPPVS